MTKQVELLQGCERKLLQCENNARKLILLRNYKTDKPIRDVMKELNPLIGH